VWQEVVGKEAFEGFMKEYVQRFQYKTLSSEDFKADFLAHFAGNPAVDAIDWATWFTKPGAPPSPFHRVHVPKNARNRINECQGK
jgi:leukotriene-A4 hydrolase